MDAYVFPKGGIKKVKVYACTGLTSRCITLAHAYYLLKFEGGGAKELPNNYMAD